jgi:hypothetical protein
MAAIEPRTFSLASPPTSGTMIGGCGAIPAKTMELSIPIALLRMIQRVLIEVRILPPEEWPAHG